MNSDGSALVCVGSAGAKSDDRGSQNPADRPPCEPVAGHDMDERRFRVGADGKQGGSSDTRPTARAHHSVEARSRSWFVPAPWGHPATYLGPLSRLRHGGMPAGGGSEGRFPVQGPLEDLV